MIVRSINLVSIVEQFRNAHQFKRASQTFDAAKLPPLTPVTEADFENDKDSADDWSTRLRDGILTNVNESAERVT